MRSIFVRFSLALLVAVTAAACGEDDPVRPTTPVTLKFKTLVYRTYSVTALDTVRASVFIDGGTTEYRAPEDSIQNFPRGEHTFEVHFDTDYLVSRFTEDINPFSSRMVLPLTPEPTCRIYSWDATFCSRRNFVTSRSSRVYCPVTDFGEFCAFQSDRFQIGGTWPTDSVETETNEYIAHGKLLIGATIGTKRVATAFYDAGDYSPRRRHHVVPGDSSTWQSEVWTDARHIPLYPDTLPKLAATDRADHLLGLAVRTTYVVPSTIKNAMFIRFDVTNISDSADYRRVHPNVPVGGHTINNIYLAPVIDADIGGIRIIDGVRINDAIDDNHTYFPDDSLVIAYDQEFAVPSFGGGYNNKPGLVGMRLVEAPAGTVARALLLDSFTELSYGLRPDSATLEDSTYRVISGGRPDLRTPNCALISGDQALVCREGGPALAENEHDVLIGFSIGSIGSLGPGQSTSVTIAIIFAPPAGSFTSGATVNPQNTDLTNTTRSIYGIAANIRALAATVKGFVVNGTPR